MSVTVKDKGVTVKDKGAILMRKAHHHEGPYRLGDISR
jgi:hypothetical protein